MKKIKSYIFQNSTWDPLLITELGIMYSQLQLNSGLINQNEYQLFTYINKFTNTNTYLLFYNLI